MRPFTQLTNGEDVDREGGGENWGERENEGYQGDEENGGDRGGNRTNQGIGGCDDRGEDSGDSEAEEEWEVTPIEEEQKGKSQALAVSFFPLSLHPEPQQALCI